MNTSRIQQGMTNITTRLLSSGVVLMLFSATCFVASIILIKIAGDDFGISFWLITLCRFAVGLVLVQTLFHGKQKVAWRRLFTDPWLLTRGLLGGSIIPLYNLCILELGAGRSTILSSSYPIFAALLAPLLVPENLKLRHIVMGLIALGGIFLMTGPESFGDGLKGYDALAVFIAIVSGLIVVIIRKLHATDNTATILAAQCVFGFIICVPGSLIDASMPSLYGWFFLVGAALLVAMGQLTMTQGFKYISVSRGSSLHLLTPVLVTGASIVLLGEFFTLLDIIGGLLIVFSCLFIVNDRWVVPLKSGPKKSNKC
ncbi:MAG: DMT family transporter [Opitutaceae bacterium]|nr:DMT family transporter [Opitutaceae bacterium]